MPTELLDPPCDSRPMMLSAEPPDHFDDDHFDDDDGDDDDGGGDDYGEPVRWITVATFSQSTRAQIARLKLESEDIPCIILDENLVATDWFMSIAVGGIKVQVPEPEAARAVLLLGEKAPHATETPATQEEEPSALCPRCGASNVYRTRFSRRMAMLSILLLGLPLSFGGRRWRCARCGWEWR